MIEAQENLAKGHLLFWPHMKSSDYSEQHRAMHKVAFPDAYEKEEKSLTPEQLQAYLAGGLNG